LGDNARLHAPMTADDQTTSQPSQASRRAWKGLARRMLRPYARHRDRLARMESTLGRLEADFEHVRERHTEQIERLEDLARELVLAGETLRRELAAREHSEER
jgi:hypothetical protein